MMNVHHARHSAEQEVSRHGAVPPRAGSYSALHNLFSSSVQQSVTSLHEGAKKPSVSVWTLYRSAAAPPAG